MILNILIPLKCVLDIVSLPNVSQYADISITVASLHTSVIVSLPNVSQYTDITVASLHTSVIVHIQNLIIYLLIIMFRYHVQLEENEQQRSRDVRSTAQKVTIHIQ